MLQQLFPGAELPVMAMVAADKASHMTSAMSQTFVVPGGPSPRRLPATWPLDRIVAGLNELQPDVLTGYSSMVHQLTREAAAGRLRITPRAIATTSEPLLPETREAVAAVWQAPLFNGFGSTEGLMGGSCSAGRGLHLSDDLFVIEPVDAHGNPVPPGGRAAKVYLTSLYNRTQPLIRYELTDEIVVLDGRARAGRASSASRTSRAVSTTRSRTPTVRACTHSSSVRARTRARRGRIPGPPDGAGRGRAGALPGTGRSGANRRGATDRSALRRARRRRGLGHARRRARSTGHREAPPLRPARVTSLPDHLPILDRRGARRVREPVYVERELTAPVDLCDARGRLNPEAVGFARQPLVRANLSGHWPRKKRWNFWNWIGPECVLSVTLADIDLASSACSR
jgi:hypothetical protein